MDNILICTQTDTYLDIVLKKTIHVIKEAVFEIATEKFQHTCLWATLDSESVNGPSYPSSSPSKTTQGP